MARKRKTKVEKDKENFLIALKRCLGVVTVACESTGMPRSNHYFWMRTDPEYVAKVDEISEVSLDFAESKLHSLIKQENPAAIFFYLKTKGKRRGFIERQQIEHGGSIGGKLADAFKELDKGEKNDEARP